MQHTQSSVHNTLRSHHTPPIIMLDPAGDAEHPGRSLEQHFERGLTLQYADYMHHALEQHMPHARIIVTRTAGDKVTPLQHANFANRLDNVILYLHCAFYKEQTPRPVIRIYRFSYHPQPVTYAHSLSFARYDHAYQQSEKTSEKLCTTLYNLLHEHSTIHPFFDVYPPCAFPHAALCGIARPALVVEIGLSHDNLWQQCADLVGQALSEIFTSAL